MRITDINDERIPQWFRDAKKSYQKWYYNVEHGKIVWKSGQWKGTWQDGWWQHGWWYNGTWKDGTWENGWWQNGTWQSGTWYNGTWQSGTWENGIWQKGKIYDPKRIGNYQDDWQWSHSGTSVTSLINPKQYFKDSHIPRQKRFGGKFNMPAQLRDMKNYQKYMNMSDQQLVKLVGKNSVQQWLDEWYYDQFNKIQFLLQHKDELNQSVYRLIKQTSYIQILIDR